MTTYSLIIEINDLPTISDAFNKIAVYPSIGWTTLTIKRDRP